MQDLVTVVLAVAGAKLACILGDFATSYLFPRVLMRTSDMLAVVPVFALPVLTIAVVLGWLLILIRPSASVGAIGLGLLCVALMPLAAAIKEGRVPLNRKLQGLRNSVLTADVALRATPCDPLARSRYRGAVLEFFLNDLNSHDRTGEIFVAAGERRQVTDKLNEPAFQAVGEAFQAEIISRSDIPAFGLIDPHADVGLPKPNPASPLRCR